MIRIDEKENCSGCTACGSICPTGAQVLEAIRSKVQLWEVDRDAYMQYRFYIPISRP